MSPYQKAPTNARQFKCLTSLSIEKFDILLPIFESKWERFIEKFNLDGTPRLRKYVAKNEAQLPTMADKLCFLLFYKKTHCLQEVMDFQFDLDVSMVNKWIHLPAPVLNKSLERFIPKANIEKVDFQIDETYIIDATERPIQQDTFQQETFYRGKKKTPTLKNVLIISALGIIVWLGETYVGKVHDKTMVQALTFNTQVHLLADLGFLAWRPANLHLLLPHKKPRNTKSQKKELTQDQKDFNKARSNKRVKIENVLAHVKILRLVKDKNRNYRFGFRENLMKTACGLYNFRKTA